MATRRTENWLALSVLGFGLLLAAIPGLWVFMAATATQLHERPQDVASLTHEEPGQAWAGAVEQGRQAVRAAMAAENVPGLSVAVGSRSGIVWAEGFGWADLEQRTAVSPDTAFRIGTASTALTSAGVGLLLENGRLSLDNDIQTAVPEFPDQPWPVTLRQLMAHVAGLRNDGGDEGPLLSTRCARPADALPQLGELLFEPGSQFRYSSYGWILVSAAVEAAAGEPFLEFMRTHVFEPLGMTHTHADFDTPPATQRAVSYFPRFASDPRYGLHVMRPLDYSCYAGAGAFVSTPSDLVRFALAIDDGTFLQPATAGLLQAPQRLPSGEATGYGLGWDIETVTLGGRQVRVVGHDGEVLGGTAASLLTVPGHGIAVAVTSNISYTDTFALAAALAETFATASPSAVGHASTKRSGIEQVEVAR